MRMSFVSRMVAASALALAAGAVAQSGAMAGVTEAMLRNVPAGEWLSYGRDYAEQRFSPLKQVNEYTACSMSPPRGRW
jgi:quinohemoprotein ethanol dehydrogenase